MAITDVRGICEKCGLDGDPLYAYGKEWYCKSCLILQKDSDAARNIEKKKDEWDKLFSIKIT